LSDGLSIQHRRITKPCFRTCSADGPRSQAPFYLCARSPIADRAEGTFGLLRYRLGGDRPSQTAQIALSAARIHGSGLELKHNKAGVSLVGSGGTGVPPSRPPSYATHAGPKPNTILQLRFTGSFRLAAGMLHLHNNYSFTESLVETVIRSLRHSCRSELTRQGTSLP
jgi:hypothetical protein